MSSSKIQKTGRMEYFSDHAGSFSFSWCTPITVKPMANHRERERDREIERVAAVEGEGGGERKYIEGRRKGEGRERLSYLVVMGFLA